MERKDFDIAAGLVDRIDKLEKTIFDVQEIMNKKSYRIIASDTSTSSGISSTNPFVVNEVILNPDEIATVVFVQDILEYYVNTLNLELNELRKTFDEI